MMYALSFVMPGGQRPAFGRRDRFVSGILVFFPSVFGCGCVGVFCPAMTG